MCVGCVRKCVCVCSCVTSHLRGHKGTIWSLLVHGNWLFSSSSDSTIKVWDIADLRKGCIKTVTAHKDCVSVCVCVCACV